MYSTCISMHKIYTLYCIRICTHKYSHCNVQQNTQCTVCAQYTHNYKYICMCSTFTIEPDSQYEVPYMYVHHLHHVPCSCPMNVATSYSPNTTLTYNTCSLRPYDGQFLNCGGMTFFFLPPLKYIQCTCIYLTGIYFYVKL